MIQGSSDIQSINDSVGDAVRGAADLMSTAPEGIWTRRTIHNLKSLALFSSTVDIGCHPTVDV